MDEEKEIKLVMVGGKGCGKSALAVRFLTRRFIGEYDSNDDVLLHRTLGIADKEVQVQIKDTTGMDWLRNAASLLHWASGIIVVYSITDRASFIIATDMLEVIHSIKPLSCSCTLLVGNKSDLVHLREVPSREAKRLSLDFGVQFIECTAAECFDDIHNAFTRIILEALLVDQARKLSGELSSEGETNKKPNQRTRKRATSSPQPCKGFSKPQELQRQNAIDIPEHIHTEPVRDHQIVSRRKQSLRRKISGIGSKLVGSQYTYK